MNKIKNILYILVLIAVLILPYFVFAQGTALDKLKDVGGRSGYVTGDADPYLAADLIGVVANIFFSILSLIFIVLMLYGGYNWMTATGESQKVDKAKDTIRRAVIGLIVIVGSYAIWLLVRDQFFTYFITTYNY